MPVEGGPHREAAGPGDPQLQGSRAQPCGCGRALPLPVFRANLSRGAQVHSRQPLSCYVGSPQRAGLRAGSVFSALTVSQGLPTA